MASTSTPSTSTRAPGEDLLFFGRIHPDKGTATPSRSPGEPAADSSSPGSSRTSDTSADEVEPHIDGERVRFLGPVPAGDRAELLGGAHALLHLIDFDEPFGYSVVEAMACGTPVIAYDRGSMAELIDHNRSGYLVNDIDQAVDAVELAGSTDRPAIRASTVERFNVEAMVSKYVDLYRTILSRDGGITSNVTALTATIN